MSSGDVRLGRLLVLGWRTISLRLRAAPSGTLQHYPALLASLTIAAGALISSLILTYQHIQQRRAAAPVHRAQVGDHSGQHPLSRGQEW